MDRHLPRELRLARAASRFYSYLLRLNRPITTPQRRLAAAQLQQSPTPLTGGVFERSWWRYYDPETPLWGRQKRLGRGGQGEGGREQLRRSEVVAEDAQQSVGELRVGRDATLDLLDQQWGRAGGAHVVSKPVHLPGVSVSPAPPVVQRLVDTARAPESALALQGGSAASTISPPS